MSRSVWKGPYIAHSIKEKKVTKIWSRASTISPEVVYQEVEVHNGKEFVKLLITPKHVGFKFGDFAPTKVRAVYKRGKLSR